MHEIRKNDDARLENRALEDGDRKMGQEYEFKAQSRFCFPAPIFLSASLLLLKAESPLEA